MLTFIRLRRVLALQTVCILGIRILLIVFPCLSPRHDYHLQKWTTVSGMSTWLKRCNKDRFVDIDMLDHGYKCALMLWAKGLMFGCPFK